MLVRARDELVGVVALQLHAKHARKSVRLAAKRDGSHSNFLGGVSNCVAHANIDSVFLRPLPLKAYQPVKEMALDLTHAKRAVVRVIVDLDNSPGPHLRASWIDIARHVKPVMQCNLARALQAVVRLRDDPAFQTDNAKETLGVNLLDRDCVADSRTRAHLTRLIVKTTRKHQTGQFFIPSRARARFVLTTKVREKNPQKIDWYLDYETRVGKPIRSFAELERDLA